MNKLGTIVLIDDDEDDLEIFNFALLEMQLKNKVLLFSEAKKLIHFMSARKENVFFILCDISMPSIDCLKLRSKIASGVPFSPLSVPFLFFSTAVNLSWVSKHQLVVGQDFFIKPTSIDAIKEMFITIISHWKNSCVPNAAA